MDRERVVASIVALLLVIVSICKAQRFRFLALSHVFEGGNVMMRSHHQCSSHDQN